MRCDNCKKTIHFWNNYHRRCPAVQYIEGVSKNLHFCRSECAWDYMRKLDKKYGRSIIT